MKAMLRMLWRDIRGMPGRFAAIAVIVALSVAFFTGLRSAGPDMELTARKYYEELGLMDLQLVSTYGLDGADLAALDDYAGQTASPVVRLAPGYSADVLFGAAGRRRVIRLLSADLAELAVGTSFNRPLLIEGRMPEAPGECAVDEKLTGDLRVGDTLHVSLDGGDVGDLLVREAFTVVGTVRSPLYITSDRGGSSVGSGSVAGFAVVPAEDFVRGTASAVYVALKPGVHPGEAVEALAGIGAVRSEVRYAQIREEGRRAVEAAETLLAGAQEDAKAEIGRAWRAIDRARADVAEARRAADEAQAELDGSIAAALREVDDGRALLDQTQRTLRDARRRLDASAEALVQTRAAYRQAKAAYDAIVPAAVEAMSGEERTAYEKEASALSADAAKIARDERALEASGAEYDGALRRFYIARNRLDEDEAVLNARVAELQGVVAHALGGMTKGEEALRIGQENLAEVEVRTEADLESASRAVDGAEAGFAALRPPEWCVLDRGAIPGLAQYEQDARRIGAVGGIFPWIFCLVAMLACFATIARMVEEQRAGIGILKALGFTPTVIAFKYVAYAFLAGLLGVAAGVPAGAKILPGVICSAYSLRYNLPALSTPLQTGPALTAALTAVILISLTAMLACRRLLAAAPATLMRPRVLKPGRRVFLERIAPLWHRMRFPDRVMARNLLHHKGRFLMTVAGVAGCGALLLTGFGVRDSIDAVLARQFGGVLHYDVRLTLDDDTTLLPDIEAGLSALPGVEGRLLARQIAVDALSAEPRRAAAEGAMLVTAGPEELPGYVTLRDRITGETLLPPGEGAVITEKLALLLGVESGDDILIEDSTHRRTRFRVVGITENYALHYIYLSPEAYRAAFGGEPRPNTALLRAPGAASDEEAFGARVLSVEGVRAADFVSDARDIFGGELKNLASVARVLILAAAALALAVLRNLADINLAGRRRELAILRMLGFRDGEVRAYIYRESAVLTVMGATLGLFLGAFLHRNVIAAVEISAVMFGRTIEPLSYLWAALLPTVFALIAHLITLRKLRRIDMVTSLKGVE